MKVEGSLDSILSNYSFYVSLNSKYKKEDEIHLRNEFIKGFEEKNNERFRKQLERYKKLEIQKKSELSVENNLEQEKEDSEVQKKSELPVEGNSEREREDLEFRNATGIMKSSVPVKTEEDLETGMENLENENTEDGIDDEIANEYYSTSESSLEEIKEDLENENVYESHRVIIDELVEPYYKEDIRGNNEEESDSKAESIEGVQEESTLGYEKKNITFTTNGIIIDEWKNEDNIEGSTSDWKDIDGWKEDNFVVEDTIKYDSDAIITVSNGIYIDQWGVNESIEDTEESLEKYSGEDQDENSENNEEDEDWGNDWEDSLVETQSEASEGNEDWEDNWGENEEDNVEDEFVKDKSSQQGTATDQSLGKDSIDSVEKRQEVETPKQEVVVVPTNIRDYVKANQGIDIGEVLKYYDKKALEKAVSLGKIYRKSGKLYT